MALSTDFSTVFVEKKKSLEKAKKSLAREA